jgi:three-Cys-motif partner protein
LSRVTQRFGSAHTEEKLKAVHGYLQAFVRVLKNRSFSTLYLDVCAGSGSSQPRTADENQGQLFDKDDIVLGSALRALDVDPPFDRYVLNDVKLKNVKSLRTTAQERPDLRIDIEQLDATQIVDRVCAQTNWRSTRAVAFLDPYGLKPIKFSAVQALAKTRAVDLWYLIPVGAMNRQVANDGRIIEPGGSLIDELLGTSEWRNIVIEHKASAPDLFGELDSQPIKVGRVAHFERIAMEQLRKIFEGGVASRALALGRGGSHEFSLVFACANPSAAASSTALKIANHILKAPA